jgi:hypothetical protein
VCVMAKAAVDVECGCGFLMKHNGITQDTVQSIVPIHHIMNHKGCVYTGSLIQIFLLINPKTVLLV